jgi:hypothetical protein
MNQWHGSDPIALTKEVAERLKSVTEGAELPSPSLSVPGMTRSLRELSISAAAWWGRTTHQLPIRMARALAIRHSTNADEPAMLTIMFGLGLVLLTYAVHLTILGVLSHSMVLVALYLISLVCGAYWAAFAPHVRR